MSKVGLLTETLMQTDKVTFISDYFFEKHTEDDFFRDQFFYLKLHALFNCLTASEVLTLYLEHSLHNEKFRSTLLSFVGSSAAKRSIDYTLPAKKLLENYTLQPYSSQISYRTFLNKVVKFLDRELIIIYFNLFIRSDRINDRKKAYEVADIIWTEVEEMIWKNYFEFGDKGALEQVINHSSSQDIAQNVMKLWTGKSINNKLKKSIIEKTADEDLYHFDFLKTLEPTFYIQALLVRKLKIDKKLLGSIVKRMKKEQDGYIFYYVGLAKEWDLLIDCLETIQTERIDFKRL